MSEASLTSGLRESDLASKIDPLGFAQFVKKIRSFFDQRACHEVITPVLREHGSVDQHMHHLVASQHHDGKSAGFLQPSPEYAMKMLLSEKSCDLYQCCPVFRADEKGRWHHPVFTMLEWYRVNWDHFALMQEVLTLVAALLGDRPRRLITYSELFRQAFGINPIHASFEDCIEAAKAKGHLPPLGLPEDKNACLDWMIACCMDEQLSQVDYLIVYHYPASMAALSRLTDDGQFSQRFELFVSGVECGNGFYELNNAVIQRERFMQDNALRLKNGLLPIPIDEDFLASLAKLPDCSGVALGLDRLYAISQSQ
jgi:elongation factor P--(R)-beta-lysine ligase